MGFSVATKERGLGFGRGWRNGTLWDGMYGSMCVLGLGKRQVPVVGAPAETGETVGDGLNSEAFAAMDAISSHRQCPGHVEA